MRLSVLDLATYASAHLTGEETSNALLSAALFKRLHEAPFGDAWALGWARVDLGDVAALAFAPEANAAVALATNGWNETVEAGVQEAAVMLLYEAIDAQ